jgi:hypothetical protein
MPQTFYILRTKLVNAGRFLRGNSHTKRAGQSIIEVLVATAVGSIMVIAAVGLISPALRGNRDVTNIQVGSAIAKEAIDQIRAWGESDWHNLSGLSTSSANTYFLVPGPTFRVATGTESILPASMSGLVGYWKFDELIGSTSSDFSGYGHHGSWVNGPSATSSCRVGSCIGFNGTTNYVNVPNPSSSTLDFSTNTDFSVTFWVKANSFGNTPFIVDKRHSFGGTFAGYTVYLSATGAPILRLGDGVSVNEWAGGGTNATGTWNFYAVSASRAGNATLYTNGTSIGGGNISAIGNITTANSLYLGTKDATATNALDGLLDEVRIYDRALTSDEVGDLYRAATYFRNFYLDVVNRDGSDNIADGAGTYDPSTLKLTVNYNWIGGTTSTMVSYLTRAGNRFYQQTDWSRGGGIDGPGTSTGTGFATSSNIATSSGSFEISLP